MMKTAGDDLAKALELLRRDGWCTGLRHREDGTMCAVGAVERAVLGRTYRDNSQLWAEGDPRSMQALDALAEHVPEEEYPEYGTVSRVACYNNSHTREDVEEWFEKAIANAGTTK